MDVGLFLNRPISRGRSVDGQTAKFGEMNDVRVEEIVIDVTPSSSFCPVAVSGEIGVEAKFLGLGEEGATLFAAARSPEAVGVGDARILVGVAIAAFAEATILET